MKLKATEPEVLAAMRTASSASEPSFACKHLQIGRNDGTSPSSASGSALSIGPADTSTATSSDGFAETPKKSRGKVDVVNEGPKLFTKSKKALNKAIVGMQACFKALEESMAGHVEESADDVEQRIAEAARA